MQGIIGYLPKCIDTHIVSIKLTDTQPYWPGQCMDCIWSRDHIGRRARPQVTLSALRWTLSVLFNTTSPFMPWLCIPLQTITPLVLFNNTGVSWTPASAMPRPDPSKTVGRQNLDSSVSQLPSSSRASEHIVTYSGWGLNMGVGHGVWIAWDDYTLVQK